MKHKKEEEVEEDSSEDKSELSETGPPLSETDPEVDLSLQTKESGKDGEGNSSFKLFTSQRGTLGDPPTLGCSSSPLQPPQETPFQS